MKDHFNNGLSNGAECSSWLEPETQVAIDEFITMPNGILTWLNRLDPCNDNFLLPNLQIVHLNAADNKREVQKFEEGCNQPFEGPDGVISVLNFEAVSEWIQTYKNEYEKKTVELFETSIEMNLKHEQREVILD